MKIGYSTLGCPEWDLSRIAEELATHGYDGVEIRGMERKHLGPGSDATEREQVREMFDVRGVDIVCVTAYTRFTIREELEINLKTTQDYIRLARDIGASYVRIFGGNLPEGPSMPEVRENMLPVLRKAADYAQELGIELCLETHDGFCRSMDARGVVNAVGHPALKILWDIHHPIRVGGESIHETYENVKDCLAYVHIKDAFTMPDGRRQLVSLGAGDIDIQRLVELLHRDQFSGYLMVEWERTHHPELPLAEVAMPQHIGKLRQYLRNVIDSQGDKS